MVPLGRANGTIGITIGTNCIIIGTIGKTSNDIGIPLGNPEHTYVCIHKWGSRGSKLIHGLTGSPHLPSLPQLHFCLIVFKSRYVLQQGLKISSWFSGKGNKRHMTKNILQLS